MIPALLAFFLFARAEEPSVAEPVVPHPVAPEAADPQALAARVKELEETVKALQAVQSRRTGTAPVEESAGHSGPLVVEIGQRLDKAVTWGPIDVKGNVLGDAVSVGSDIVVRSSGVVEGNAVAVGGNVVVEPGGLVEGDRIAIGEPNTMTSVAGVFGDDSPSGVVRGLFRQLSVLSCLMGAGVLLMGLWPQNVERVARPLGDRPFWYGIAGGILTASVVVGFGLLSITVVGIPLAFLLALVLALAWLLGVVALCKAIGERFPFLRGSSLEDNGAWATFLAGACVLGAVSLLPYVGPLLVVLVGFPAVGAALLTRFGNRRAAG